MKQAFKKTLTKIKMKNKKGGEELVKIILWVVFFVIALGALYFLMKNVF